MRKIKEASLRGDPRVYASVCEEFQNERDEMRQKIANFSAYYMNSYKQIFDSSSTSKSKKQATPKESQKQPRLKNSSGRSSNSKSEA